MNKKLVFAFYLAKNYKSEIINIHFLCLKRFSEAFDSAEIVFILDKEYDRDNLLDAQRRFTEIFCGKPLSFSMVDNTPYREALVFQQYVVARMDEEELVFFAHNKGTTNVDKFDKEQIYTWVIAMYFYSLNYMDEVEDSLLNKKFMSYGPFLCQNEEPERITKFGWYYVGTFFWMNTKKIKQHMINNNVPVPLMGDRFYAEEFFANIFPSWPYMLAASHGNRFLKNATNFYYETTQYLPTCYDVWEDNFYAFYEDILNHAKIK